MKYHLFAAFVPLFGTAAAADFTAITIERTANASVDETWKKIGPFCALRDWLAPMTCDIVQGNDHDMGSVRSIDGGRRVEVMVGATAHSYVYVYTVPDPTLYHGQLEAVADGPQKSRIIYTIVYDQDPKGNAEAKAAFKQQRIKQFTAYVETMVKLAEGKKP